MTCSAVSVHVEVWEQEVFYQGRGCFEYLKYSKHKYNNVVLSKFHCPYQMGPLTAMQKHSYVFPLPVSYSIRV